MKPQDLYSKKKCPSCQNIYVTGYDTDFSFCPSCKRKIQNDTAKNNAPPLMSDGRFITNYSSSNELTETMRKLNGFANPNEFRAFLQQNAKKFMDAERQFITKNNLYTPDDGCCSGWYQIRKNNKPNSQDVPKPYNS